MFECKSGLRGEEKMLLTTGEKIKNIRKECKITQKKLSDGVCSEQFLSQVEKNKKHFSEKNLEKIWNKIKFIAGEEIEKKYSLKFLKESKEKQLKKQTIEWIKNINQGIMIEFYEIENFFKNNDYFKEKIIIYNCIGEYYRKNKNYINANYYYNQILDDKLMKYSNALFLAILLKVLRNNYF